MWHAPSPNSWTSVTTIKTWRCRHKIKHDWSYIQRSLCMFFLTFFLRSMWWRKTYSVLFTVNSSTVSMRLEWMWTRPSPILILRALSSMSVVWDQGRAPTCSRHAVINVPSHIWKYSALSAYSLTGLYLCRFWSRTTLVLKTEPSWSQCVTWDPKFLSTVLVSSRSTLHRLGTGWYLVGVFYTLRLSTCLA